MDKLFIKPGKKLTPKEIAEVNEAKFREWKIPPMSWHNIEGSVFFHLRDREGHLLALGQAIVIPPFKFLGETFNLLGTGGIIANIRGKGYGTKLMHGIMNYLDKRQKTDIGFCGDEVGEFYKKCGLKVVKDLTKRFVYYKGRKRIINNRERNVFCHESSDKFLTKILSHPKEEVIIPREPDW